jgi:hypothetical protein
MFFSRRYGSFESLSKEAFKVSIKLYVPPLFRQRIMVLSMRLIGPAEPRARQKLAIAHRPVVCLAVSCKLTNIAC